MKPGNFRFFVISIAVFSVWPAWASHNFLVRNHEAFRKTDEALQQLIKQKKLDGVSIGVVTESGLAWFNSLGYANREKAVKASERSIYRVGSLTKLFTATAVLQLDEQGVIDIDQAASAYISRFYYKTRFSNPGVITPRHLLTHLSGLPSDINKGHWTEERFSDLVERLHIEYASYPVDFITNYSNLGYSLLGVILEENTDYLYEEYMQKHLFEPLHMEYSDFQPYGSNNPLAAVGYKSNRPQPNLPLRDIPAMGLNSNLVDLSHFIQAILNDGRYRNHQILTRDSIESMFTAQNSDVELDFDNRTGIPWRLSHIGDEQVLVAEHAGTTLNFSSQVVLAPQQKIGIIILSNTSQANSAIHKIALNLLRQLTSMHKQSVMHAIPQKLLHRVKLHNDGGKARYLAKSGIIEIDKNAGKICECQSKKTLNLVPLPDGWFGLSPDNKRYSSKISEQVVDGEKVIVLDKNGKKHRVGTRFKPADNRFNWEKHFGDYQIVNPDERFPVTDVRVFDEDNMTYLCYRMPKLSSKLVVLPITPVSETEAITEGLGRSKGETVYSKLIDGQEYLIYSGYIARKVADGK